MLRYNEFNGGNVSVIPINEEYEANKFKRGDKVIFKSDPSRDYYKIHDGKTCEVVFVFPNRVDYTIKTPNGAEIMAHTNELTSRISGVDAGGNYIENQFTKPEETSEVKQKEDLPKGTRVSVTGKEGKIEFKEEKGTIKKSSTDSYQIEFDEDDSKNKASYSMLVSKELVTKIDEPSQVVFSIGDKVECVDIPSQFYQKKGYVTKVWPDGECMVEFREMNTYVTLQPYQMKIIEYAKTPIGFTIPLAASNTNVPITTGVSEEEDDDEASVAAAAAKVPMKKEDLLEFSYKDMLKEDKISTHDELMESKAKYEKIVDTPETPKLKKVFTERILKTIDIIDSYYDFLINKVAGGLPVYRTVEEIEDKDLLRTKTKVRASESKELTRKYSFDQGIIAYWKFKDAVVFRTI